MSGAAFGQLHPAVRAWLDQAALLAEQETDIWPDRAAAAVLDRSLFRMFGRMPEGWVDERELTWDFPEASVRIREYRAPHARADRLVILVHGGGYVFGSIDDASSVATARSRALAIPAVIFDVDYRLAPENPFPAGLHDVTNVLRKSIDDLGGSGRIVLDGISSGAALAVGSALSLQGSSASLVGLVVEVPSLDLRPDAAWGDEFAAVGGVAPRSTVRANYLNGHPADDPYVSPMVGKLEFLPPTHVLTAEVDPLRAIGDEFVDRLRRARVDVTGTRHLGAAHGSANLTGTFRDARLWQIEVEAVIREFLGG